jgi:hypothetical protein
MKESPNPLITASLPDKRGLGKAKITDRINRIDKIYIKNPDNPVNPVENRHERFFVSGIEIPAKKENYECAR